MAMKRRAKKAAKRRSAPKRKSAPKRRSAAKRTAGKKAKRPVKENLQRNAEDKIKKIIA